MRWVEADVTASAPDRHHTAPPDCSVAPSGRGPVADLPLPIPPRPVGRRPRGGIEAALQCTKTASVSAVSAMGNWRGTMHRIGNVRLGRSMVAMIITEWINLLDDSQKCPRTRSDIVAKLPLRPSKSVRSELSPRPGVDANTLLLRGESIYFGTSCTAVCRFTA
jgi:hypothetical protein